MKAKTGIDVHCHLEYIENAERVIKDAKDRMRAVICSVPDPKDVDKVFDLRNRNNDFLYLCLGFHPEVVFKYSEKEMEEYIEEIRKNRKNIVGIGEVGLDYSWVKENERREKTRDIFVQFIELAKELKLPLVVHARNLANEKGEDAFSDCLRILTDSNAKRVVMHCFSGNEETLNQAIEQDYWISFATIICRSDKHKRLAAKTPIENMLLETDSPWLDPDSRELVNRPWKIERSAEVIAQIKNTTKEEILNITTENAIKAFDLKV